MVRLSMNLGFEDSLEPKDVVGFIANEARLDRTSIGAIRILDRQTLVDISERDVEAVMQLNGMRLKGRKLLMAPAR